VLLDLRGYFDAYANREQVSRYSPYSTRP
jgi:hypothetical protein